MKKKNFLQTFGRFLLIFVIVLCCGSLSACAGMPKDLKDEIEEGDFDPEETDPEDPTGGINIAGVKVLRKPSTYDFNGNVTDKDGSTTGDKDFFHSLSSDIIELLFRTYGNFNTYQEANGNVFKLLSDYERGDDVSSLATRFEENKDDFVYFYDALRYPISDVAPKSTVGDDGSTSVTSYEVTVDQRYRWTWSVAFNDAYKPWVQQFVSEDDVAVFDEADLSAKFGFDYENFHKYYVEGFNNVNSQEVTFVSASYQSAFINEDYVNTLTYAIYSLVLGRPIDQISVNYSDTTPKITIANRTPADALAEVKALYNRLATYVGLTERNKSGIVDWVLDNIIGTAAQQYRCSYRNENGEVISTKSLYYEQIVDAIVRYCATKTTIGKSADDSDPNNVGEPFMASEIADFPLTSFFSALEGDPFQFGDGAFEYQSFVLMPSTDNFAMTDLWLDFKYDAKNDGDESVTNTSITINVTARWRDDEGTLWEYPQTITVKDGPIDVGTDGSILLFDFEGTWGSGNYVKLGRFNEPDDLKTDKNSGYVKTLTGLNDARKYYSVLEGKSYNSYGVLNPEKISGSYFEVAFDVVKAAGDTDTNYAFYCAISQVYEPENFNPADEGFV